MGKIAHLPSKARDLEAKLQTLVTEEIITDFVMYKGQCGKSHAVRTSLNVEEHGIMAGDFFTIPYYPHKIFLCVGTGDPCKPKQGNSEKVLWYLNIERDGIQQLNTNDFRVFQKSTSASIVQIPKEQ